MNTRLTQPLPNALPWEPKTPFDLVLAYDDTPTRNRALLLYDRIAQTLLDDYDFRCSWWRFDHLRNPVLLAEATDAAIEAHMIVLALYGDRELPALARRWMDQWTEQKAPHKSALVALVDITQQATPEAARLQGQLQSIARRARMDFFFHALDSRASGLAHSVNTIGERATTVTPVLQEILHQRMTPANPPLG